MSIRKVAECDNCHIQIDISFEDDTRFSKLILPDGWFWAFIRDGSESLIDNSKYFCSRECLVHHYTKSATTCLK